MTPRRPVRAATRVATVALAIASLLMASAGSASGALSLTRVAQSHAFNQPLFLTNAGDGRLFVVEKGGKIKIIHPGDESVTTFLDISGKVSTNSERGLLGLAFHPNYDSNGLFYVDYTDTGGDIVIAEYERSSDPDVADEGSERILLTIEHSSRGNHNGGWIEFKDEYLYISVGDGAENPSNAQSLSSLLGKILRIDPADPDGAGSATYGIPPTNPYVGEPGMDEIWARGLRNPWRCSHDPATGKLWCGDVGQNKFEEIDRKGNGRGRNFGWPLLEGRHYYDYPGRTSGKLCTSRCKTLPIVEYKHAVRGEDNCSVTGGYVARRPGALLEGEYMYADLCGGRVWSIPAGFRRGDAVGPALMNTDLTISSFGRDSAGRLYLVDYGGGVYLINDT